MATQSARAGIAGLQNVVNLSGQPTDAQMKDKNWRHDKIVEAANVARAYQDYTDKAKREEESLSRMLWLVVQGYFLALPDVPHNDLSALRVFMAPTNLGGKNHAAICLSEFEHVALELARNHPARFNSDFFSTKGSHWQNCISRIRTALLDGVNPVARDANQQLVLHTIEDASKARQRILSYIKEQGEQEATLQKKAAMLASPEGRKKALAHKVAETIEQLLDRCSDVDQLLKFVTEMNFVQRLANTIQSQGGGVLPVSAKEVLLADFEKAVYALVNADTSDVDKAVNKAATKATIDAMQSGLSTAAQPDAPFETSDPGCALQQDAADIETDRILEGYCAAEEGKGMGACEYEEGTLDRDAWLRGFKRFINGEQLA